MMASPPRILVAGIGGASLGTEIGKALKLAGDYEILGCDIAELAYGHFDPNFARTWCVDRQAYVDNVLALCAQHGVQCVIPGADESAQLIGAALGHFAAAGVAVAANDPAVVARLGNKATCFEALAAIGAAVPATRRIHARADLDGFPMPCVVKPATGSGGSTFVHFARDADEAAIFCAFLHRNGKIPIVQEYLSEATGEFTVGVLSLPDRSCAGAIALKRSFHSKLSIAARGDGFLISSGYSQGLIEPFPEICAQAVDIATKLGSAGPLNIQGRLSPTGALVAFEINPRFSASTYLRALAGFNEIDFFVRHIMGIEPTPRLEIRPGWYLRSLSEVAVPAHARKP
jgi:carbamoyl-phosphate synthase large subunit